MSLFSKKTKAVWHVIAMVLILTGALYFSKSTITGNVVASIDRLPVDLDIDQSQSFVISNENNKEFSLHSLRISGEVVGKGAVKIYVDNGAGILQLVYSNAKGSMNANMLATEFTKSGDRSKFIIEKYRLLEGTLKKENEEFVEGNFRNACIETCSLDALKFTSKHDELIVYVDQGVKVHLEEILST